MHFDLTEALIDQIVFSMEEQGLDHVLDVRGGVVVSPDSELDEGADTEDSDDAEERYIPIPEWNSADGFKLMERFAAGLRNPIVRMDLTSALDRGRGVFRAFKDVLTNRPEVERLWYSFKEKEMRRVVLKWYNALREEWGLEKIGEEPEETEDLVLEDFRIRAGTAEDDGVARELHEQCLAETYPDAEGCGSASLLSALRASRREPASLADSVSFIAETSRGDFAGFTSAQREGACYFVSALDVGPEYRGLGIGETLLARLLETVGSSDCSDLVFDLPIASEAFSRVLLRDGFRVFETRYSIDLARRRRSLA